MGAHPSGIEPQRGVAGSIHRSPLGCGRPPEVCDGSESIRAIGGAGCRSRVHPVDPTNQRSGIKWQTPRVLVTSPLLRARNHGILPLETALLSFKLAIMAIIIHSGLLPFIHLLNAW